MLLSKSDYMMFLKHPAWLWLRKHDKDKIPEPDARLQAMFDQGNKFEAYAEKLFPDGVKLSFDKGNYGDYDALVDRTQEALDNGAQTIFQARFKTDHITCIIDILDRVSGNTFDLIEVKSSTKAKLDHEFDLAFQVVVLEQCGLSIRHVKVMHVNNQYVRDGEIDPGQLVATTDITEQVRAKVPSTENYIAMARTTMESTEPPSFSPREARLGSYSDWLEIYQNIEPFGTDSIYNLTSVGAAKVGELEDRHITTIAEIPDDFFLNASQRRQVEAAKQGTPIIQANRIRDFLSSFTYPLYFFDYETFMELIPPFDGLRPYQQFPFQYSIHVVAKPGDEPEHREYLHEANTHPGEPLLKQLRQDIGPTGTLIAWNDQFERRCNNTMARLFPEFTELLSDMNNRMKDLMWPFAAGWYVDKEFMGRTSIKNVLPVLVPELSYEELAIQEGGSAQRTWTETVIEGQHRQQRQQIFDNLREYNKLDTLAMVEIYNLLNKL